MVKKGVVFCLFEDTKDTKSPKYVSNKDYPFLCQEESSEPPAIVIYMIDPFSYGNDNMDLVRLSSIGLLRFFLF